MMYSIREFQPRIDFASALTPVGIVCRAKEKSLCPALGQRVLD